MIEFKVYSRPLDRQEQSPSPFDPYSLSLSCLNNPFMINLDFVGLQFQHFQTNIMILSFSKTHFFERKWRHTEIPPGKKVVVQKWSEWVTHVRLVENYKLSYVQKMWPKQITFGHLIFLLLTFRLFKF